MLFGLLCLLAAGAVVAVVVAPTVKYMMKRGD